MSFSNNCKPERMPGPITGNPLNGLTDRASIQVQKIFDACMKQETLTDEQIVVTNLTPSTYTAPLTFEREKSTVAPSGQTIRLRTDGSGRAYIKNSHCFRRRNIRRTGCRPFGRKTGDCDQIPWKFYAEGSGHPRRGDFKR